MGGCGIPDRRPYVVLTVPAETRKTIDEAIQQSKERPVRGHHMEKRRGESAQKLPRKQKEQ